MYRRPDGSARGRRLGRVVEQLVRKFRRVPREPRIVMNHVRRQTYQPEDTRGIVKSFPPGESAERGIATFEVHPPPFPRHENTPGCCSEIAIIL